MTRLQIIYHDLGVENLKTMIFPVAEQLYQIPFLHIKLDTYQLPSAAQRI